MVVVGDSRGRDRMVVVGDSRGRDRMVVGFVQSVSITTKVVSLNPVHGKVYSI